MDRFGTSKPDHAWSERKRPATRRGDTMTTPSKTKKAKGAFKLEKLSLAKNGGLTRFADDVHHFVYLCPVMVKIMSAPVFQRLGRIKQLGTTYLTFRSADHTRLEHSVGVAHLAREMCLRIHSQQPYLGTTEKDILCVTLAGLLHDLGHGPFSHTFESFRHDMEKKIREDDNLKEIYKEFPDVPKDWDHEDSSLALIDVLLKQLGLKIDMRRENLDKPLLQIGDGTDATTMRVFTNFKRCEQQTDGEILTNRDFIFIKECIRAGPIRQVKEELGIDRRIGREEPEKEWLYDIVANRHNGLDVDKLDYLARDERRSLAEAGKVNIAILYEARVAKATGSVPGGPQHYMICYPKKCVKDIISVFRSRFVMHDTVYQHKTTHASTQMVLDILKLADPYYRVKGLPISRTVADHEAYATLTDTIIDFIAASTDHKLQRAAALANRYLNRDLYKYAGHLNLQLTDPEHQLLWERAKDDPDDIARQILDIGGKHRDEYGEDITIDFDDIIVSPCSWHWGNKNKDVLARVRFINRGDLSNSDGVFAASQVDSRDYMTHLPQTFQTKCIRFFCRDSAKAELLTHLVAAWKDNIYSMQSTTPSLLLQQLGSGEENSNESNYSASYAAGPVPLTQDSGDEADPMSPIRSPRGKRDFGSPVIPVPRNFFFPKQG